MLPLVAALSQIAWNHMTGTEDQLFEDCMKLQKEPKRVGIFFSQHLFICLTIVDFLVCMTVYGVNGCVGGIWGPDEPAGLHQHGLLHQTDEGDHSQTCGGGSGHPEGEGKTALIAA